jgi:PAS domain S-box-containing protein
MTKPQRSTNTEVSANERRWRALVENSNDGIAVFDTNSKLVFASPAAAGILGYTVEEFLKIKTFSELQHPDDLPMIRRRFTGIGKPGARATATYRVCAKDGSYRWLHVVGKNALDNPDVRGIIVNFRDITAEKQAEASREGALKEAINERQKLHNLFMQFPAPVCLFSFDNGNDDEPVYEFANQPYEELFGQKNLANKSISQALPHLQRQGIVDIIKNVFRSGEPFAAHEFAATITKHGGQPEERFFDLRMEAVCDAGGHIDGVITFGYEVTEQTSARRELARHEAYYRQYAEAMPQMAFIADPEGDLTYFNERHYRYFGGKNSGKGWDWTKMPMHHPDDLKRTIATWTSALNAGTAYEIEYRLRRHDGEYRWHLGRAEPLRNANGEIEQWLGTNTDIHELKMSQNREHELRLRSTILTEQRDELISLNRAKDEFLSLASHQLRTPATSVKQYVGMLQEGYAGKLSNEQQSMVKFAFESNERQLNIIDTLLNVARLESGRVKLKRARCNLKALLAGIIREQKVTFDSRQQRVIARQPRKKIIIDADEHMLRMSLENLLDNAGKYSPQGKSITVTLSSSPAGTNIAIADEGIGIKKSDQSKLFQKFVRVDNDLTRQNAGSGLGLYWAKKIIDLHGGQLTLDSKIHRGTIATVTLPHETHPMK